MLVIESDCTFGRASQPSPGEPVCSDICNCRRSLIRISLTVFTFFFLKQKNCLVASFLQFLLFNLVVTFYKLPLVGCVILSKGHPNKNDICGWLYLFIKYFNSFFWLCFLFIKYFYPFNEMMVNLCYKIYRFRIQFFT